MIRAKKSEYFTFNHNPEDGNIILADKINDPDVFLVFSVSKAISEVISSFYPGISSASSY